MKMTVEEHITGRSVLIYRLDGKIVRRSMIPDPFLFVVYREKPAKYEKALSFHKDRLYAELAQSKSARYGAQGVEILEIEGAKEIAEGIDLRIAEAEARPKPKSAEAEATELLEKVGAHWVVTEAPPWIKAKIRIEVEPPEGFVFVDTRGREATRGVFWGWVRVSRFIRRHKIAPTPVEPCGFEGDSHPTREVDR